MKILYYLPVILLLLVVLLVEQGWVKVCLIILLAISLLVSKYKRKQTNKEIEFDERVKANIIYYSFSFMLIMNALLVTYFLCVSQLNMTAWLTYEYLLIYLLVSIFVPLYIIPTIAKRL